MNNTPIFAPKPVVNASATPKVGDILAGTWGYEATLWTFAKVVGVSGKSVRVQELEAESFNMKTGGMEWQVRLTDKTVGPVKTRLVKAGYNGSYHVRWDNVVTLYPYHGNGVENASNYH